MSELPDGVFGDVSFQNIYVKTTDVDFVHPSALLSAKDDLERLWIWYSHLVDFPWETLTEFSKLVHVNLEFNEITEISSFENPTLEELYVSNNKIATLQNGLSVPKLRNLNMSKNCNR